MALRQLTIRPANLARGVRGSFTGPRILFVALLILLGWLFIPPLIVLVVTSLTTQATIGGEAVISLDNYRELLSSPRLPSLLWNSLVFAIGTAVISIALGSTLAWLVERTDAPFKRIAYFAAFTSLAIPFVIRTIGWVLLLGPGNGVLTRGLESLTGEAAPFNLYSLAGMTVVNGLSWTPAVFLLLSIPFRAMDPSLEEAALVSGANQRQTFSHVTLKLARPALVSVLLLTIVQSIEAFETPAIIGLPGRVSVLTTQIYQELRTNIVPDFGSASAYALILMLLVAVGVYYYSKLLRQASRYQTITGKGFRPRVTELGRARFLGGAVVMLLPTIVLLPFAILVWASLQNVYAPPSAEALSMLTVANYQALIDRADLRDALLNSLLVGMVTATLAGAVAVAAVWLITRTDVRGRDSLDFLATIPLVFPPIVLALAIVRTYLTLPIGVYGTLAILVIAYLSRQIPFAMRYTHAGIIQIKGELEEAAYVAGAGRVSAFSRVMLPLMAPSIAVAWAWVFLQSVSELSIAVILSGPNSRVIAMAIFDNFQYGRITQLSALSVTVSVISVAVVAVIFREVRRRGGVVTL